MATTLRFLFILPLGFIAACFAGAFALLWPFLAVPPQAAGDPVQIIRLALLFIAQAAQIGSVVVLPWAVFMIVSELAGLRSLLLHAGAGLAGSFITARLAYENDPAPFSIQTALLVAGLAFMLVYWLIAGRNAGNWRQGRSPSAEPPAST